MKTKETTIKKEQADESHDETQKLIENHKKAAIYFETAAKRHRDAAKQYEEGSNDEATKNDIFDQEMRFIELYNGYGSAACSLVAPDGQSVKAINVPEMVKAEKGANHVVKH